eukprot:scaffold1954_cov268-Pinguiococcus_pyrenoidosus.AAC.234
MIGFQLPFQQKKLAAQTASHVKYSKGAPASNFVGSCFSEDPLQQWDVLAFQVLPVLRFNVTNFVESPFFWLRQQPNAAKDCLVQSKPALPIHKHSLQAAQLGSIIQIPLAVVKQDAFPRLLAQAPEELSNGLPVLAVLLGRIAILLTRRAYRTEDVFGDPEGLQHPGDVLRRRVRRQHQCTPFLLQRLEHCEASPSMLIPRGPGLPIRSPVKSLERQVSVDLPVERRHLLASQPPGAHQSADGGAKASVKLITRNLVEAVGVLAVRVDAIHQNGLQTAGLVVQRAVQIQDDRRGQACWATSQIAHEDNAVKGPKRGNYARRVMISRAQDSSTSAVAQVMNIAMFSPDTDGYV